MIKSFRGTQIPDEVKNKTQLIEFVLENERFNEPISNSVFVFDLRCTRFGGVLHDLRQAGWDIVTMAAKQKGYYLYYLVSMPGDNKTTMRKGNAISRKRLKSIA